jgi:uncharacterized repeat protein (TIGR03837 family)
MSLFGYENPALPGLLQALQATPSTVLAVPEGRCWPALVDWFGVSQLRAGQALQRGGLQVRCLPFLDQDGYDELLWCCDWNLVRGEDSLAQAVQAAKPCVWQIYPQDDGAHGPKLLAYLDAIAADAPWRAWHSFWNGTPADTQAAHELTWPWEPNSTWPQTAADLSTRLAQNKDLCSQLIDWAVQRGSKPAAG